MKNRKVNLNAKKALEDLKMEIANEFDAKLTDGESFDGALTSDLVKRAENKISNKDTFNPS